MKAYITCPVTHSQERLDLLPKIKQIVEAEGIEAFVFAVGGEAKEIFERDYDQLKSSDIIIAEVSERSHGVGIELGMSYGLGLRRILLQTEGQMVTKLAQGMPETHIITYSNVDELTKLLKAHLKEIKNIAYS